MTERIKMVTLSEACHVLGKSRPTVMSYIDRGMPVVVRGGKGRPWEFNPKAIKTWQEALDSNEESAGGTKGSYEVGRARKVHAEASIKEIALAKARGESVSVALVEERWATIFSNVKTRMLAIVPRLAPIIPACDGNIVEIEALLNREIKSVLRALAESAHMPHDDVEALAADDD